MITQRAIIKSTSGFRKKQKGATLLTVMIFLVLMTVVTVSATKISILDVLISGNDQQKVQAFQLTANNLKLFARGDNLTPEIINKSFDNPLGQFETADSTTAVNKKMTDMEELYDCERAGQAGGIGPNAPQCRIYDFKVNHKGSNTGVREEHHQGGGRMMPNGGCKGCLNPE